MMTIVSPNTPLPEKPEFSTVVPCDSIPDIRLTALYETLKRVAPFAKLGDWTGRFDGPPSDDLGIGMLSVDGISLTMLRVEAPLPIEFFSPGKISNLLMPDPLQTLADHKAHINVRPVEAPTGREAMLRTARAVTLLTRAASILTGAKAFKWLDAANVATVQVLEQVATRLEAADSLALPAWVRPLAALGPVIGNRTVIVGSYGHWAFDLPEVEFEPNTLPLEYLLPRLYAVCEILLTSSREFKSGDTIELDHKAVFKLEDLNESSFSSRRALRLLLPKQ